jgi:hypothetical protein
MDDDKLAQVIDIFAPLFALLVFTVDKTKRWMCNYNIIWRKDEGRRKKKKKKSEKRKIFFMYVTDDKKTTSRQSHEENLDLDD